MKRLAIVLFNLGGPDGPDAVKPFLFNLFNDPAIIGAPGPVRWALAKFISSKRAPVAREIYSHMGGKSPILDLTIDQANALDAALTERMDDVDVKSFVCMRYWHPMSGDVARVVKEYGPDHVVLLPLYPQYSTSTTASSFDDWEVACRSVGLDVPTHHICCYPTEPGFIRAQADLLSQAIKDARNQAPDDPVRVLYSAHGLPKKIVEGKGDPYPRHVELGAAAIADAVATMNGQPDDWLVSYQSRVGPLEWIGPSTEDEIVRAGRDGCALVVLPIAFVSEHSETLVELDIEYRELAEANGVKAYVRVPAVGTHSEFIAGLAGLVESALGCEDDPCPQGCQDRICNAFERACPARLIR